MRLTRAERQAQTRQALVDAAAEVVLERGFEAASVEAIATRAGFTRGAFYANFASKRDLFAEVLQQRVFSVYAQLASDVGGGAPEIPSPREVGERLAALQHDPHGSPLFRMWLEVLAHAARDPAFRATAAAFWRANRAATARAVEHAARAEGVEPAEPADVLATISLALDIGIALQRFVDPEAVPLEVYPTAYELLHRGIAAG